ncbi:MAG: LysR family transcriptional regulator [Proteobacteria bacterium]|nr:LysR family transcriptional regulator [Pseudomonadota bacterium]
MKLDWLIYFKEVARTEHLAKAAKILCVSPSAVSRALKLLEEEVGCALFEHYGKRIRLTTQGRKLFERVIQITSEIDNLPAAIGGVSGLSGTYRIAASNLLADFILAPIVAEIFKKFSEFKCDLRTLRSSDVVGGVLRNEFDIGLCFSPQPHPDLTVVPIFTGHLRLVVRAKHPILDEGNLARLSTYGAVLPPAVQGIEMCDRHPMFEQLGIVPRPVCTFDHYGVAAEIVSNSDAWSLFPDFILPNFKMKIIALPEGKNWHAPYQVALVASRLRTVDALNELLKTALTDRGAFKKN